MPRWLLWTVAAVVSWGIWAVLAKLIGGGLTGAQSQVLSTVGIVPVVLALARAKDLTVRPGGRRGVYYALAAGIVSGSRMYHTTTCTAAAAWRPRPCRSPPCTRSSPSAGPPHFSASV